MSSVNLTPNPFPLRFLFASNPKVMTRALAIVYRTIATHLTRKAGFTKPTVQTGAMPLIQRFDNALNMNIHLTCMDALMSRAQESQERLSPGWFPWCQNPGSLREGSHLRPKGTV